MELQHAQHTDMSARLRNDNIVIINASYELESFLNYYSYNVYNLADILVINITNVINSDNHTAKIIGIPTDHNSHEYHKWHGQMLHFKNSIGNNPQFYPMPFYMSDHRFDNLCSVLFPKYTKELNRLVQHICYYLANLTTDDTLTINDELAYKIIASVCRIKITDPNTKWIDDTFKPLQECYLIKQQYNADTNTITSRSLKQINAIYHYLN